MSLEIMLKSFFVKWAPVLIVLFQAALSFSNMSLCWRLTWAVLVVGLFAANHFLSVSRPFERFQRFETTKRDVLEQLTKPMREQYEDRALVFTTRQGVCGESFTSEAMAWADLTEADPEGYELNTDQIAATENLRFVLSFPIRRIDPETQRLADDVIGVVNIDSRTNKAERLIPIAFSSCAYRPASLIQDLSS